MGRSSPPLTRKGFLAGGREHLQRLPAAMHPPGIEVTTRGRECAGLGALHGSVPSFPGCLPSSVERETRAVGAITKTGAGGAGWDVSEAPSARASLPSRGAPPGLRSSAFRQHRRATDPSPLPAALQGAPLVASRLAPQVKEYLVVGAGRSWLLDRQGPAHFLEVCSPDCKTKFISWMLEPDCRRPCYSPSPHIQATPAPGPAALDFDVCTAAAAGHYRF